MHWDFGRFLSYEINLSPVLGPERHFGLSLNSLLSFELYFFLRPFCGSYNSFVFSNETLSPESV
jgi:hypothetical protein